MQISSEAFKRSNPNSLLHLNSSTNDPKTKNHSNAVKITVRKTTHVATAATAKLQLGLVILLMLNCLT